MNAHAGEAKKEFLNRVTQALADNTFVKVTLGKCRGVAAPKKIVATVIDVKGEARLNVVISRARHDDTKNFPREAGVARLGTLIGETAFAATLFTTEKDYELTYNAKGETRLITKKAAFSQSPPRAHDRTKPSFVDASRPYLKALGVCDGKGVVKPSMYAKYRQICHFIEIAAGLIAEAKLDGEEELAITDICAGKGYLTFALYDYVTSKLGRSVTMSGLELRSELVALCNGVAASCGFTSLTFEAAAAGDAKADALDMLIALHACDTATDDAIFQGIKRGAKIIIVAPCCQHEVLPQLNHSHEALAGLMKFGLFRHREADLITDAARALLMEAEGYKVKIIEFVSMEHTAKNVLIAGVKSGPVARDTARRQYNTLKSFAGFETQRLEALLALAGKR